MNRAVLLLLASMVIVGAVWLAGAYFYLASGVNPLGRVDLFTWWRYWSLYSDHPVTGPQLTKTAVYALITVSVVPVLLAASTLVRRQPLHGDAKFADSRQVKQAGLLGENGIIVGQYGRRYLMFSGEQFVSMVAPTRSGKGVGVVLPNLLNFSDSVVVLDVKDQENFKLTSKFRAANGQAVYQFSPFSITTHGYNPLAYLPDDPRYRITEIMSIAQGIYPGGDEDIWTPGARDLFVGLAIYLCETPDLPTTIGEILRQSSGKGRSTQQHLQDIIHARNYDQVTGLNARGEVTTTHVPKGPWDGNGLAPLSEACIDSLSRFVNTPDKTAGGILKSFTSRLTLWTSPIVDAATSRNDFDLRELRTRRMSVYVGIPLNRLPECGVLVKLFYTQLINLNTEGLLHSRPELKYQCLLLNDEFPTLGYMQIFDMAVGQISGYGLRLLTVIQSKGQISKRPEQGGYGTEGAKVLINNHALTVMFTPKDNDDARDYSETLGYKTVKSRSTQIRQRWRGTESDQRRALMLPQELLQMPLTKQIVHLEGHRPIYCQKIRYYADPIFIDRLKSVSPSLAALGRALPNKAQIDRAMQAGELSAFVPTTDLDLHEAIASNRTRIMTTEDVAGGVKLEQVATNISSVSVPTGPNLTDGEVDAFVNDFWEALDHPTAIKDNSASVEYMDQETGEVIETNSVANQVIVEPIDMALLKA